MSSLHVIVVGAGICGLSAATALRPHHRVTILERSSLNEEIGAAITSNPPCTRVLESWGFSFKEISSPVHRGIKQYTPDGQILRMMENKQYQHGYYLNHRIDVHRQLKKLALDPDRPGAPADIRLGVRIRAIDCESATVTLESGEEFHGDVILGCDGLKSFVRSCILGDTKYRAEPSGLSAYRFLLNSKPILADPEIAPFVTDSCISLVRENDRTFVCYPCRGLTELNCVVVVPDLIGNATESWRQEGDLNEMKDSVKNWAPKFHKLLDLADSCKLWQLRDQDPLPYWTRGKAIVLGDAAHPMMPRKASLIAFLARTRSLTRERIDQGSGASMAVEDVEALTYVLGPTSPYKDYSLEDKLKIVEKIRYVRASIVQLHSRAIAGDGRGGGEAHKMDPTRFFRYVFEYEGPQSVSVLSDEEYELAKATQIPKVKHKTVATGA
ncbi:FAD/NAD(P)-binding domain-containing protein [Punctularia strigosozonata HHB-11173 SS5]|uniref:FAD/NAD(P)-binding domain-containing protein n=1 Tax=Punctularia strigosozonata (strain HHB-11173) TaxID=741275 RepID=UPI000441738A|nr:FAD/NAD(P)-binding domain-containing protein [Punctularia strigosozonata HHB-11173 SS5]EIN09030.1 FAD/NAD(P)-binding domain-containing protein [Punctularia strigosozonata HHB-11173 SS5]